MAANRPLSISAAWDDVRELIRREQQMLIAIAGAFFLLPLVAFSLFTPESAAAPAATPEQAIAELEAMLRQLAPWLFLLSLVQMVGQLAIVAAVVRAGRSVGEAIVVGVQRVLYLLLASIVLGFAFALVLLPFGLVIGLLATAAPAAAAAIGLLFGAAIIFALVYVYVRLALMVVVLVHEDVRWPLPLLRRSWELTRGNALPIFGFFLIVGIVIAVASIAVAVALGIILALAGLEMQPGGAGAAVLAVANSIVSAAGSTIFVLMQVAIYRRVVGGADASDVFA